MIAQQTYKKLFVIIPDRLSDLIRKGEITERYYNPGNLFDEVHIIMINDDKPDSSKLQSTVGRAKLYLHNLPAGRNLFIKTLGWRPWLLRGWAAPAIELAEKIGPTMIRCHGANLNAYLAYRIKCILGIPYIVSLHTNMVESKKIDRGGFLDRLAYWAQGTIEKLVLKHADMVLPVYLPVVHRLEQMGIQNYVVCYNVLNPIFLQKKENYALHDPVEVVSVGRQLKGKNPENLIRAIATLPKVKLTLIGDGPLHTYLKQVAKDSEAEGRVEFIPSLSNDELCRRLPDYDVFAAHTDYWEIPKSVLEPLLTGLPVVINRRLGLPVPELTEDVCISVDNTVDGYKLALERLMGDDEFRIKLGAGAFKKANSQWAPSITEAKYMDIYSQVIAK